MEDRVLAPLLGAFLGASLTTGACTPAVARLARRLGVVDHPGGRRAHARPTPRLGGVALALGLLVGAAAYGLVSGIDGLSSLLRKDDLVGFLLPCMLVFVVGLVDDVRGLSPGPRIAVEAAAAGFLIQSGYVIDVVANPFGAPIDLGPFAFPVTIAWFVGVTNAFNLVDGLDGLLGSVSLTALLGCAAVAVLGDRPASALLIMAAAGATCGFLVWNWHPARVFMGDSGSLLLGMAIAALSIKVARNPSGTLAFHVPLLLCGLPIAETFLTLARRHVSGQPYFSGDRSHIHHVLVNKGLTVPRAVLSLAGVSALFAATAVASRNWRERELLVTCVVLLVLAGLALRWLGYLELRVLVDRLIQVLRGRRQLSDLVALAAVGEAIGAARTVEDLKARLRAAVDQGRFEFIALELAGPRAADYGRVVECRHPAAERYLAGRDDATLWLFSAKADGRADEAAGSIAYTIPLGDPAGSLGTLVCQRALRPDDGAAGAIARYVAAPLVQALCPTLQRGPRPRSRRCPESAW